jgi:acyl-CoA synthetase (NDP forming)
MGAGNDYDIEYFDTLFNPQHIAFIGATEKSAFGAMMYLTSFKDSIWKDTFYPVNPKYDKVLKWKCYPSVLDIPYEVDTAYLSVKTKFIPQVLKECVEKKIPWVVIFASGFSETGKPEGVKLEQEVKQILKGSNTRAIGPNCLGPFNAENGMAFSFADSLGLPGAVSFMSQSGGHLTQLVDIGFKRDIRFRYGVSFGNQIDLNCLDFLRHFHHHDKTGLIAAYLESFGSSTGHDFFLELQKTTKVKPVIIWKGGYTDDGSRAAFSHTGAIASKLSLWKTMIKQSGAVLVKDNEEFWDTIKTFELLYPSYIPKGRNVGIITPGGGNTVNLTDLMASYDLSVPLLTKESQEKIGEILPEENVNIRNPVDLGALGFVIDIYVKCIEIVVEDPNIDIIIIPLWPDHTYHYVIKRMIKIQKGTSKPFAFCLPSIADAFELAKRFKVSKRYLHKNRVLYYLSLREAARSFSHYCSYIEFLKTHNFPIAKR